MDFIETQPVNYLMETLRLQCMHDPIMQAIYRNEILWADVPDDDPPLELDGWREYNARRNAEELAAALTSVTTPIITATTSVPSSPLNQHPRFAWSRSVPSTPRRRMILDETDFPSITPLTPCTPRTPASSPPSPSSATVSVVTVAPTAKPRTILDSIREVESASHTPDRTQSPPVVPSWRRSMRTPLPVTDSKPTMKAEPSLQQITDAVQSAVKKLRSDVPAVVTPKPIRGAWANPLRATSLSPPRSPSLRSEHPTPSKRRTVMMRCATSDSEVMIRDRLKGCGSIDRIIRTGKGAIITFRTPAAAAAAVRFGLAAFSKRATLSL